MTTSSTENSKNDATASAAQSVRGRSLFVVETTAAGIAVQTALLTEDNRLMSAPAVFPDVGYALSQIEELRAMVLQHFTRAAQVGAQVLAAQAQTQGQAPTNSELPAAKDANADAIEKQD